MVSLITMVLAGAVAVVATPAGCKLAQNAGLHIKIGNCGDEAVSSPVARLATLSPPTLPTGGYSPPASPSSPPEPSPTPLPPYQYPASSTLPPYARVGSAPLPESVTLACRLPIYQGPAGSGGFVVFPGGSFVADPRSNVTLPTGLPSPNPGQGYGQFQGFGLSYDRIHGRWFPVPMNWASPDGNRYVYPGPTGIYVINPADNTFSEMGEGQGWSILTVDTQGVYATLPNVGGLWLLPFSGAAHQITATGYWQAVGGGAAYGTASSAVPSGVANPIVRLDLKTGASVPWFWVEGASSQVVGFDHSGSPLISVSNASGSQPGSYLWLVPSVGGGITIAVVLGPEYYFQTTFSPNFPPIADANGTWFSGGQGMFLFVPNTAWYLASTLSGQLAGACS